MTKQELERKKNERVRRVRRLLSELEELERKIPDEEIARSSESMLDFYIPKGLRNIHRLPRLGMRGNEKSIDRARNTIWDIPGDIRRIVTIPQVAAS